MFRLKKDSLSLTASFENQLQQRIEKIVGVLFFAVAFCVWALARFVRKEPVDFDQILFLVSLSFATGAVVLVIPWSRISRYFFLSICAIAVSLVVQLVRITGTEHNAFTHIFYLIILVATAYFRGTGVFLCTLMVLYGEFLCAVNGHKAESLDEFILISFSYISVAWVGYLFKSALITAKEDAVAMEVAGGIAHELSQPLLVIEGTAELLENKTPQEAPAHEAARKIREHTQQMQESVRKLQEVIHYRSKEYVGGIKIMDIDRSSKP